jgi:hypothetical protein
MNGVYDGGITEHLSNTYISAKNEPEVTRAKIATSNAFYQFYFTYCFLRRSVTLIVPTKMAPNIPETPPRITAARIAGPRGYEAVVLMRPNLRTD